VPVACPPRLLPSNQRIGSAGDAAGRWCRSDHARSLRRTAHDVSQAARVALRALETFKGPACVLQRVEPLGVDADVSRAAMSLGTVTL
jgi:hypothetical protein